MSKKTTAREAQLDGETLKALKAIRRKKTVLRELDDQILAAAIRTVRRVAKEQGHPLTGPQATDLTLVLVRCGLTEKY